MSQSKWSIHAARERGRATSEENSRKLCGLWRDDPEFEWIVRFMVPFSYAASKNSLYGRNGDPKKRKQNYIFIRKEAKDYRDAIALLAKDALRDIKVKHSKIWIGIFVEKSHHRGDAINVVDLICDALKLAIPVDDRWYSIRRLDWSINRHDPHLFIEIAQERGATDSKVCRFCGEIRPLTDFTNSKHGYLGKDNECFTCRAPSYPKGPNKKYRQTIASSSADNLPKL